MSLRIFSLIMVVERCYSTKDPIISSITRFHLPIVIWSS